MICNKNRDENVKKYLATELERLAQQTLDYVEPDKLGEYHHFFERMLTYFLVIHTTQKITLIMT